MIDERDQELHDSMMNRLMIMRDACKPFLPGRGRMAGMANTVEALNIEIGAMMVQAWRAINSPRFQGAAYFRFIAQRHAELSLCYSAIQTSYDELCQFNLIPKEARTELTTRDMAALSAAQDKPKRKRRAA